MKPSSPSGPGTAPGGWTETPGEGQRPRGRDRGHQHPMEQAGRGTVQAQGGAEGPANGRVGSGAGPLGRPKLGTNNFIVQTRTHFERMGDTKNHFSCQLFEQTKSFYGNDGSIKQLYSKKFF